jgi:inner membrane protein
VPSVITHGVVAVAAGVAFAPKPAPRYFWSLAILCSVLPDIDSLTFYFGLPYHHLFAHRGFFHSPFFAFLVSVFLVGVIFRDGGLLSRQGAFYLIFFFLLTASHGILDAFTNGGLGVALLAPFDSTRYFSPWRPILVSPIGIHSFFSHWGLMVLKSELIWVWLPSALMIVASVMYRFIHSSVVRSLL